MRKFMFSLLLTFHSSLTFAGPDQIDVIGLIPGVSSAKEVNAAGVNSGDNVFYLEIGGYKLPCLVEFLEGKLALMYCMTGKKYAKASNIEIHEALHKGFMTKFDAPDSIQNKPIRTRLGVEYNSSEILWIDKHGNRLALFSMHGNINDGALFLTSSAMQQKEKEASEQREKARKF